MAGLRAMSECFESVQLPTVSPVSTRILMMERRIFQFLWASSGAYIPKAYQVGARCALRLYGTLAN